MSTPSTSSTRLDSKAIQDSNNITGITSLYGLCSNAWNCCLLVHSPLVISAYQNLDNAVRHEVSDKLTCALCRRGCGGQLCWFTSSSLLFRRRQRRQARMTTSSAICLDWLLHRRLSSILGTCRLHKAIISITGQPYETCSGYSVGTTPYNLASTQR